MAHYCKMYKYEKKAQMVKIKSITLFPKFWGTCPRALNITCSQI